MTGLALVLAGILGQLSPIEIRPVPYDTIYLKSGAILKGRLFSDPDAAELSFRKTGERGLRVIPRLEVRKMERRMTAEEAHDKIASSFGPDDVDSWYRLALGCMERRPPLLRKAEADLAGALSAQPGHIPSVVLLVRVYLALGELKKAKGTAERAASRHPRSPEPHAALGEVLEAMGKDPRNAFRKAVSLRPSAGALARLVRAEMRRGDIEAAAKTLVAAERQFPDSTAILVAKGELEITKGNLEEAKALYLSASRASRALITRAGREARDEASLGLAAALYLQGRFKEADAVLLKADPSAPRTKYLLGLLRLSRGDMEGASRLLRDSVELGVARAHLGLGYVAYEDLGGDHEAALAAFGKALEAQGTDPYARYLAGWTLAKLGRYSEAADEFIWAAELEPASAAAHSAAGASLLLAGKVKEAEERYWRGLATAPEAPELLAGLGLALAHKGEFKEAGSILKRARELGPRTALTDLCLGYIAAKDGRDKEAEVHFASALDLPGGGAYARDALLQIYAARKMVLSVHTFDGEGKLTDPFQSRPQGGVEVSLDSGSVLFGGAPEEPGARSIVFAAADGVVFRLLAAAISPPQGAASAGVFVRTGTGLLEVGCDGAGRPGFRMKDGKDRFPGAWETISAEAPGKHKEGPMQLRIELIETKKDLARFSVWSGGSSREVEFRRSFWRERAYTVGLYAVAEGLESSGRLQVRFGHLLLANRRRGD